MRPEQVLTQLVGVAGTHIADGGVQIAAGPGDSTDGLPITIPGAATGIP